MGSRRTRGDRSKPEKPMQIATRDTSLDDYLFFDEYDSKWKFKANHKSLTRNALAG